MGFIRHSFAFHYTFSFSWLRWSWSKFFLWSYSNLLFRREDYKFIEDCDLGFGDDSNFDKGGLILVCALLWSVITPWMSTAKTFIDVKNSWILRSFDVASAGIYGDLISFRFSIEISCEKADLLLDFVLFSIEDVEFIYLVEVLLMQFMRNRGFLMEQALIGGTLRYWSVQPC